MDISSFGITNNVQLANLAALRNIPIKDINFSDDINIYNKNNANEQAYIINLGDIEMGGSHWCALWCEGEGAFYFDSYGCAPDDIIIQKLMNAGYKNFYYNNGYEFQRINEQLCGPWCLMFLYYMKEFNRLSLSNRFKKMTNRYIDTV